MFILRYYIQAPFERTMNPGHDIDKKDAKIAVPKSQQHYKVGSLPDKKWSYNPLFSWPKVNGFAWFFFPLLIDIKKSTL